MMPQGYETVLNEVESWTRAKINIARALIRQPQLVTMKAESFHDLLDLDTAAQVFDECASITMIIAVPNEQDLKLLM